MKTLLGNNPRGNLFVISAPAGTGKTTLADKLHREFPHEIQKSISTTTRKPRAQEVNGRDYHFVDEKTFTAFEKEGKFVEVATVFDNRYGTEQKEVERLLAAGKHVILVIDTQGAAQIKAILPCTTIFLMPPSFEELKKRLSARDTEHPEEVKKRLAFAEHEIDQAPLYDYLIVNDNLDIAYQVLRSIIIAEEHKVRT